MLLNDEENWKLIEKCIKDDSLSDFAKLVVINSICQSRIPFTYQEIQKLEEIVNNLKSKGVIE